MLSLSSVTFTVAENEGSIEVCVVLSTSVNFVLDIFILTVATESTIEGNDEVKLCIQF